jgi:tetratricopeptide (TPR) repeat protein
VTSTRARARWAGLAVLVAASLAQAQPAPRPRPNGPGDAEEQRFWDRMKRPAHKRYLELLAQGRALFDQRKYSDAVNLFELAIQLEDQDPEAWFYLGLAYNYLDRFADCATALGRADALAPGYLPQGWAKRHQLTFTMGICLSASGQPEAAVEQFQRALETDGLDNATRADIVYDLGDALHALGRLEEAIDAYERAIELVPGRHLYRFALAVALDRDEQGTRARDVMAEAVALDPGLRSFSANTTLFVPAYEEDYYRGFALEVIPRVETRKLSCDGWPSICRPKARVHFRRYVAAAGEGPWTARAKDHLHDLGGPSPLAGEVDATDAAGEGKKPIELVVAAGPKLSKCLDGKPLAFFWVEVVLPRKNAGKPPPTATPKPVPGGKEAKKRPAPKPVRPPPPPPPEPTQRTIVVKTQGPGTPDDTARACLEREVAAIKWPAPGGKTITVRFPVSAP